ncbi:MAG TPA: 6-phosphogluconolactonase [Candidatus Eremiobacteraceae bacterium]|nr:6-phosphogluconolactonase [Candidatus Eremiobacteraceae bacterium]
MSKTSTPNVRVLESPADVAAAGAEAFVRAAGLAIAARGRFAVALSGGSTPKAMLALLAEAPHAVKVDWRHTHLFWSDERCVGPEDPDSNYGMARHALLSGGLVPDANVHRMMGELEPHVGALDYNLRLRSFFGVTTPVFDLIYLGLGPDGHTASLFPHTEALKVADQPCAANRVDSGVASPWRLTLTYSALNAGRAAVFLTEGSAKAEILQKVLSGPVDPALLPAQGVVPKRGALTWLVDRAAASLL